jgi:hypothetical protein
VHDDIRQALEIDHRSTAWQRTVDITTVGARTGLPRRLETWFYRVDDQLYLSGLPGPRSWPVNLRSHPRITLHLKHGVQVDLPAVATEITDESERRRVFSDFVADMNQSHDPARIGRRTTVEEWINGKSPLFLIHIEPA